MGNNIFTNPLPKEEYKIVDQPRFPMSYVYMIIDMIYSIWDYRISFFKDIVILTIIIICITILLTLYKHKFYLNQHTSATVHASSGSIEAPKIFNLNTNIHVWLQDLESYLNDKNITTEKQKQEVLMERLDKTAKFLVQKIIEEKKIKKFSDLESYLKSFFGSTIDSNVNHVNLFNDRKQKHDESIYQYYTSLNDLVKQAYPDTPTSVTDKYLVKQFITGLTNQTVRDQLLLTSKTDNNLEVLASAVDIQKRLSAVPTNMLHQNEDDYQVHTGTSSIIVHNNPYKNANTNTFHLSTNNQRDYQQNQYQQVPYKQYQNQESYNFRQHYRSAPINSHHNRNTYWNQHSQQYYQSQNNNRNVQQRQSNEQFSPIQQQANTIQLQSTTNQQSNNNQQQNLNHSPSSPPQVLSTQTKSQ